MMKCDMTVQIEVALKNIGSVSDFSITYKKTVGFEKIWICHSVGHKKISYVSHMGNKMGFGSLFGSNVNAN